MSEHVLIELAGIIILGIGAQWLAWRLKMPSILFLLIFGFIAGPVTGFLQPDEMMGDMLLPFVSLAVAIILFEGGLTLNIKGLRDIGNVVLGLITVGVLVTWFVAAAAAYYILNLAMPISVLLGAILVVTGPTVIGPLLRHMRAKGKVAEILKWESIVIDPIGALLAVLVFEAILAGEVQQATTLVLLSLGKTIFWGGLTGFIFAGLLVLLLKKYWVPDFLQETVTLTLVVFSFLVSDLLQQESGFFAVTLMGIIMANQKYVTIKHILQFKENLRVLMISILFIILSARLQLDVFSHITWLHVLAFLGVLIFVARPLSVIVSAARKKLTGREKVFLSWMAPRGIVAAAVSSIFALRLQEIDMSQAEMLVPITFVVIVGTVMIYGLTAPPLSRWLRVAQSDPQGMLIVGAHPWALEIARVIKSEGFEVAFIDTNWSDVYKARMADIPAYYGMAQSEHIMDEIRLDGIGKMLSFTPNDEANSLAVLHFSEVFDREELYQLVPDTTSKGKDQLASPQHLRGRFLFGEDMDYSYLRKRFFSGATIKSTKLTETFDYHAFQQHYGDTAIPLFLITNHKKLIVYTTDKKPEPKSGQTIIALVDETKDS